MEKQRIERLAVLIDADNVSAGVVEDLLKAIADLGEATVKRIYGNFFSSYLASWKEPLQRHAIKPIQQFAYTTGKNATDSALIIDAMDLLHSGRFDGFCLVSSDSDFTGLARRIREEGLHVYGFGEQKTPEAFRNACHQFICLEGLRKAPALDKKKGKAPSPATTRAKQSTDPALAVKETSAEQAPPAVAKTSPPAKDASAKVKQNPPAKIILKQASSPASAVLKMTSSEADTKGKVTPPPSAPSGVAQMPGPHLPEDIIRQIEKSIQEASSASSSWAPFVKVANIFLRHLPDFNPQHYGYPSSRLMPCLKAIPGLVEFKGSGSDRCVRLHGSVDPLDNE